MSGFGRFFCSCRGQALVELTLTLPLLIVLGLGAIEFANMINAHLVVTHMTREGANLTSREDATKGTSGWKSAIDADLTAVTGAASPVISSSNPTQWQLIYSMIVWDNVLGASCGNLNPLVGGGPDRYVIERGTSRYGANSPDWTPNGLPFGSTSSKIGENSECASAKLPGIKDMPPLQTLHAVEVFYNYDPSILTPVGNFIGSIAGNQFYSRTIFTDVSGRG
jgi:hypothetical protein